jgi:glycerol-3-phosphate acyltransferase PlsY
MIRHGSSHGLAVLVCTVVAALLVDLLKPHFPVVLERLTRFSNWLVHYIPVPFSTEQFNIIVIASILAIIWGIFFKMSLIKE